MKKNKKQVFFIFLTIIMILGISLASASFLTETWSKFGSFIGKVIYRPPTTLEKTNCMYIFNSVKIKEKENEKIPGYLDILEIEAKEVNGAIQFKMKTREKIEDIGGVSYTFYIDSDLNEKTGQPRGKIGNEYNVRIIFDEELGEWDACLDIIGKWSSCSLPFFIEENKLYISVKEDLLENVSEFRFSGATFEKESKGEQAKNIQKFKIDYSYPYPRYRILSSNQITQNPPSAFIPLGEKITLYVDQELKNVIFFKKTKTETISLDENMAFENTEGDIEKINEITNYVSAFDKDCEIILDTNILLLIGNLYSGKYNHFIIPEKITKEEQKCDDINEVMEEYGVTKIADYAYEILYDSTGLKPLHGQEQLWAFNYPVCGLADQPISLGAKCIEICHLNFPQWGIFFHELGHIFQKYIFTSEKFEGLRKEHYSESFATVNEIYIFEKIINNPEDYELTRKQLQSLKRIYESEKMRIKTSLKTYEKNPNFKDINADIIVGIIISLKTDENDSIDENFLNNFHEIFLLKNQGKYEDITDKKADSFFIAALSAASEKNLKEEFIEKWKFTVNNDYFEKFYPILKNIVNG